MGPKHAMRVWRRGCTRGSMGCPMGIHFSDNMEEVLCLYGTADGVVGSEGLAQRGRSYAVQEGAFPETFFTPTGSMRIESCVFYGT